MMITRYNCSIVQRIENTAFISNSKRQANEQNMQKGGNEKSGLFEKLFNQEIDKLKE